MKKSLIALAVLAAASGAAMAQSSVTLFGIVDAAVARVSGTGAHRSGMTNSGLNSSRLGFRGTEDLGGGMSASFWLEGALSNDDGNAAGYNFQRRSTVSLNGGFGEVRLGRDYTPSFWNTTVFDPFGTNGVGQAMTPAMLGAPVRNNNSVGYFLPGNLGGFYGQAQYAFGEQVSNAANSKQGNYLGARVGFANGPLNVAFGTGKLKGATSAADVKANNLGASYDFGMVKPMAVWAQEKVGTAKISAFEIGATAPLGAGELRAAYSRYNVANSSTLDWSKAAIGYGHNLSKRTQVYGTLARVSNKSAQTKAIANNGLAAVGVAGGGNSSGIEFGVRHSF
ncbi:MAG TPA: porin [Burkholderiaceae bacterium]|nr:porin [Burkholderiaceae bacterium]